MMMTHKYSKVPYPPYSSVIIFRYCGAIFCIYRVKSLNEVGPDTNTKITSFPSYKMWIRATDFLAAFLEVPGRSKVSKIGAVSECTTHLAAHFFPFMVVCKVRPNNQTRLARGLSPKMV